MKEKDTEGMFFAQIEIKDIEDTTTKRIFELLFIISLIFACMTILYITGVIS